MPQKVIHVGVGVFGRRWCSEFLKTNVEDGTIEVVALVDRDERALAFGREQLGLPVERCFTDARQAFTRVPADFCTVVVDPAAHEAIIDIAIEHGVDNCARSRSPTAWRPRCASRARSANRGGRWR
jgi:predicted dehydrogenase